MEIDPYLRSVLARHQVDTSTTSPVRGVHATLAPTIQKWAQSFLVAVKPSGSFAKGTAVHGGTDIDLFVSLSSTLSTPLKDVYNTLFNAFSNAGYSPRRQNVSVGMTIGNWKVDVTPGRRQDQFGNYHSLWSNKNQSWLQTNINEHCRVVSSSNRLEEIRLFKIWRNGLGLDWTSFYLELFVINALSGARVGDLKGNVLTVFNAIVASISTRRLIDPSNTNNVVSDTLNAAEKKALANAASAALKSQWNKVFL